MAAKNASLICTVFNEEKTIAKFIDSVVAQTIQPKELIIVDGGSTDNTLEEISKKILKYPKLSIKVFIKKGNRSIGRNEAIRNASSEIILSADSGCILDKKWVESIEKPFKNGNIDVVAGYYKGIFNTSFEESLIPYALVMEDKIDENNFLPATRSMAFKKRIWKKVSYFDENLSHNEDYAFANKLKKINARMYFAKDAIVYWKPRKNLKEAFVMFFRFAFGDGESGLLRDKVILIFLRYFLLLYFLFLSYIYKSLSALAIVFLGMIAYIIWSIAKNSRYVKNKEKYFYLPLLQITSDFSVMLGTILGGIKKTMKFPFRRQILKNWKILSIFLIFILTILSVITWGIPNNEHPFLYHMDEWHQFQSVRFVFKYGSPNFPGAANGSMFHFFVSGLLLLPFMLVNLINPFAIKSAVGNIDVQHALFIILRLNTLLFGVLTLVVLHKTAKLLRLSSFLTISLFTFTPVWLMLSNNFKYDIALIFWLILSFYWFLVYAKIPTTRNFVIAGIISSLSLAVKVSAIPVLPIYAVLFFLFTPNIINNFKRLLLGLISFVITFIIFGIPDSIFTGRNMLEYLRSNIIQAPQNAANVNLGYSVPNFIFFYHLPTIFGHIFFFSFAFMLLYFVYKLYKERNKKNQGFKIKFLLLIFFVTFFLSLVPFFGIGIGANRALVLLPFMVLIVAYSIQSLKDTMGMQWKKVFFVALALLVVLQIIESYAWVALKYTQAPQQSSSLWIEKNIAASTKIGIENIPIYQFEPDIVLKEFYGKQYNLNLKTKYDYFVIDSKSKTLPPIVVVSNVNLSLESEKDSAKKDLIKRLNKENYKIVVKFSPKLELYRFFGNNYNYMFSGLIAYPEDISIFKK